MINSCLNTAALLGCGVRLLPGDNRYNKKNLGPLVIPLIAAGAKVLGSAIGGAMTSSAQKSANKTNLQIARETNELNERLFHEQNEWNLAQWQRENEYNHPAAQVARMIQAGLNPAALSGMSGVSGNAPSVTSAVPAPMQSAQVQPVTGWATAAEQSIGAFGDFMQDYMLATEIKGKEIDNANKQAVYDATLSNLKKQGLISDEQYTQLSQQNAITGATFNDLVQTAHQNALKLQYDAQIQKINAAVAEKYGDKMGEQALKKLLEEINLLLQQQKTEQAQQLLAKRTGDANMITAMAADRTSKSVSAYNWSMTEKQHLENEVYKLFGKGQKAQELITAVYNGDIARSNSIILGVMSEVFDETKHPNSARHWKTLRQYKELMDWLLPKMPTMVMPMP